MIIIDGNNLWARCFYAAKGVPTVAHVIFGKQIQKITTEYDKVLIAWDAGDGGRKTLDTEYKAGRDHGAINENGKHVIWEEASKAKKELKIAQVFSTGNEADDVIASFAKNNDCTIYTSDKDLYQCIREGVSVLHPNGIQVTIGNIKEHSLVSAEKIPMLKSFTGDASDNIPKIPVRLAKNFKNALIYCVDNSNSIEDLYNKFENTTTFGKYQQDFIAFKQRALLNYQLLKSKTDLVLNIITT